jgi:hypothetical protein
MILPPRKLILHFYHPALMDGQLLPDQRSVSFTEIIALPAPAAAPTVDAATVEDAIDHSDPQPLPFVANWRQNFIIDHLAHMLEDLLILHEIDRHHVDIEALFILLGEVPTAG